MNLLMTTVQSANGILWQTHIYFSQLITGQAQSTDCANVCLNLQTENCQIFVFEDEICYIGQSDISNGTVAQSYGSVAIYTLNGMCKY